jgi:hypothetical protein
MTFDKWTIQNRATPINITCLLPLMRDLAVAWMHG